MGTSTISMVIFNSYVSHYQRVYPINIPLNHYKIPLNHYKSHDGWLNTPNIYPCNLTPAVERQRQVGGGHGNGDLQGLQSSGSQGVRESQLAKGGRKVGRIERKPMGYTVLTYLEISWNMTEIYGFEEIFLQFIWGGSWNFLLQAWYHYGWQTPFAEQYSVQWELVFFSSPDSATMSVIQNIQIQTD